MADLESQLNRWKSAGVLDVETAERIRAWEQEQRGPAGLQWQGMVALGLGALLLAAGVALFVSAHWDELGTAARLMLVFAMVAVFHLGGGLAREKARALSTALHAIGTAATGAAIALVGQIFNIQEHWPGAILLWALAALAGWALLRDEAQQTMALVLAPAWLFCEIEDATRFRSGDGVCLGRFLLVWGVLYVTVFLGTKRKAVGGILFALGAVAAVAGAAVLGTEDPGWNNWGLTPWMITWIWLVAVAVPMLLACLRLRVALLPVIAATMCAWIMPWLHHGTGGKLLSHALAAGLAVFLAWWGVRGASRALVNLGVVGFALAVVWFYSSDVLDKLGRSLGLAGLGVLFLAGGWALERTRRKLLTAMDAIEEAR